MQLVPRDLFSVRCDFRNREIPVSWNDSTKVATFAKHEFAAGNWPQPDESLDIYGLYEGRVVKTLVTRTHVEVSCT